MTDELNEDKVVEGMNVPVEAISEPAPENPYSSKRIKEIVNKHVANIHATSLQLVGTVAGDIEYDNPEVHPQMMMDNLKDASKRLEIALAEIDTLRTLTTERREQVVSAKSVNLNDLKTGIAGEFIE